MALARLAAGTAMVTGLVYLGWRLGTLAGTGPLGIAFYAIELLNYAFFALTAGLLMVRPRWRSGPPTAPAGTLDVFITVAGEPLETVTRTIRAAKAIAYPHQTFLLNDSYIADKDRWDRIDDLAEQEGITSFTRGKQATRGKAGNLNYALAHSEGDFIAVIDADHAADPDFAHWTLGYLIDDHAVGLVATPQRFTLERADHLGSREVGFYGYIQPCKDRVNAAFSCGNGAVYRREALESVGGFSEWSLVEDLHTSYRMHAAGWKSVYHPLPHTTGETPETAGAFCRQRFVWATDSLRIFFWDNPLVKRGLTWWQRLQYLQTTGSYLATMTQVMFAVSPILYLVFGLSVMNPPSVGAYLLYSGLFLVPLAIALVAWSGLRPALRAVQIQLYLSPVFLLAAGSALLRRRPVSVTDKRAAAGAGGGRARAGRRSLAPYLRRTRPWLTLPQQLVIAGCLAAVAVAWLRAAPGDWIAAAWSGWVALALATGACAGTAHLRRAGAVAAYALVAVGATAALAASTEQLDPDRVASGPKIVAGRPSDVTIAAASPVAAKLDSRQATALEPPEDGLYFGVYAPELADKARPARKWERGHGLKPAIYHWYQQWRSGESRLQAEWLESAARDGAVPLITWEPWRKPPDGVRQETQPAVAHEQILAGRYEPYIRVWARGLAAHRGPVLLRFMHEMNGNWYPWAVTSNGNSPASYRATWRYVHDIFVEEGALNVRWIWTVNALDGLEELAPPIPSYYPGEEYVDWVSFTAFNWGEKFTWSNWRPPHQVLDRTYSQLLQFDKPLMISELATVDEEDKGAAWLREAVGLLSTRYPRVQAVVFFDSRYPNNVDFRLIDGREEALADAFAAEPGLLSRPRIAPVGPRSPQRS